MKQAPHDLRDYALGELSATERAEVEAYLAAEPAARAELDAFEATCLSLREMPAEEPPRRIAFVSDKIFEPTAVGRLLNWLRLDGPRFALGMAAMLAVVFAGLWATQPRVTVAEDGWTVAFSPTPVVAEPVPSLEPAAAALDEERVRAIFEEVLAASEERNREEAMKLVQASSEETRRMLTRELQASQADMQSGLQLVNGKYEWLIKSLTQTDLAVAQ